MFGKTCRVYSNAFVPHPLAVPVPQRVQLLLFQFLKFFSFAHDPSSGSRWVQGGGSIAVAVVVVGSGRGSRGSRGSRGRGGRHFVGAGRRRTGRVNGKQFRSIGHTAHRRGSGSV
jgi:hypothetical protein